MGEKLGQHFLKNGAVLDHIASLIDLSGKPKIIEIGPGHGELTEKIQVLISKKNTGNDGKIIAIEKDLLLVSKLRKKFKDERCVVVIHGDALNTLKKITDSISSEYVIVGNIPYYITGHILRVIGLLPKKPKQVLFVIQKEVAERIVAIPPKMNLLAACVQVWTVPKIKKIISRREFFPPPKVDSALITLSVKDNTVPDFYYKIARILFSHPRKTVLNNLISIASKKDMGVCLNVLNISPSLRPQNLSVDQIMALAEKIYNDSHANFLT